MTKFLVFLLYFSSSQVILSTNIAESSVTVPDVKYGGVLIRTLKIKVFEVLLGTCFSFLGFFVVIQSLTSAWPVSWFATKKLIISLSVFPGHLNPTAISAEVSCTSCVSLHLCAAQLSLFFSGRAGRVSKGYCYRLVTKIFWNKEIQDHMIPEMLVNYLIFLLKGFICLLWLMSFVENSDGVLVLRPEWIKLT